MCVCVYIVDACVSGYFSYRESLHVFSLWLVMSTIFSDPRFEGGGKSSKLNYDIFRKAFGFLEDYQDKEIEELKKSLKKEKNQVSALFIESPLRCAESYRGSSCKGSFVVLR